MQVRDAMTEAVTTVDPSAPLADAARIMRDANVGALPVQRPGADVEGILSDRDLVVRGMAEAASPDATRVEEIMSRDLVYCYDDEDVTGAAREMQQRGVRRVLVFERETDQLRKILSLADIAVRSDDPEVAAIVLHDITRRRAA
ncbi:MAG: CBS domain-containing protein [Dehalococcoidia bacterium]